MIRLSDEIGERAAPVTTSARSLWPLYQRTPGRVRAIGGG
jgi:hypothetical protein